MAVRQERGTLPEGLRVSVPIEELGRWLRFAGKSGGVEKPGLYLLGGVMDAYSWEQSAAWSWNQMRWSVQVNPRVDEVSGWGESVVNDLQTALQSWDGVVWWLERWPDATAGIWLDWIAERKQHLASIRTQFCQECAGWFDQWSFPQPLWLQVASGLVPGGVERVSWVVEKQ